MCSSDLTALDGGADPNAKNVVGYAPLHMAIARGRVEAAQLLIARGADVNARIQTVRPYYDYLPVARSLGNDLPQMDIRGVTPYLLAAASGDAGLMEFLAEHGADPKAVSSEGVNALMIAAGLGIEKGMTSEKDALEAARVALRLGSDINAAKNDGRTALHGAAFLGWTEMMRFLAANGSNLEAKDMYGEIGRAHV